MTVQATTFLKDGDQLVPAEAFDGPIQDPHHILGSLELIVEDRTVIARDLVDDVNHLWAYLSEGLARLTKGRAWRTYLPDQPIELILQPVGASQVEILLLDGTVERPATAEREALIAALTEAGLAYCRAVGRRDPNAPSLHEALIALAP